MSKLFSTAFLKEHCMKIHAFGLGFIQIKLDNEMRLHFWHPDFKREREEAHDHRYNFSSQILVGSLDQELYAFEPTEDQPTHELYYVDCQPGSSFAPKTITPGNLKPQFWGTLSEGTKYSIVHTTFHRVSAERCVTLVTPGLRVKPYASVIRDRGAKSTCPFTETMHEAKMWDLVEDLLK